MRSFVLGAALLCATGSAARAQCLTARPGAPSDFKSAANTLFETDFSGDPVGEFPRALQFKTGALEVVEREGKHALRASSPSGLAIPLTAPLPESFTIELGVVHRNTKQVGATTVRLYGGRNVDFNTTSTQVEVGTYGWSVSGGGVDASAAFNGSDADGCVGQETTVRLQADGDRLKVYGDDRRLASVPGTRFTRTNGVVIFLEGRDDGDNAVYVTRIRLAGGLAIAQTTTLPATPQRTPTEPTAPATLTQPTQPVATTASRPVATTTATSQPAATATTIQPAATTGAQITSAPSTPKTSAAMVPDPVLKAPTGLIAEYVGTGRYAFSWSPVPNAEYYELKLQHPQCAGCRLNPAPITDTAYVPPGTYEYTGAYPAVTVTAFAAGGAISSPASSPVSVKPQRWKGYYRVVIAGFKVNRATLDDPAQIDGKWDEILVSSIARQYDENGAPSGTPSVAISKVHGDVNAPEWQNPLHPQQRIKAGSASALGGLMTGDAFPSTQPWNVTSPASTVTFPLLAWEGWLGDGRETVTIAPVIWETDRPPSYVTQPMPDLARAALDSLGRIVAARIRLAVNQTAQAATSSTSLTLPNGVAYGAAWAVRAALKNNALPPRPLLRGGPVDMAQLRNAIQSAGTNIDDYLTRAGFRALGFDVSGLQDAATTITARLQNEWQATLLSLLNNRDRPIGLVASGGTAFSPVMIPLSFDYVEQALAGNGPSGKGPGVIEIRYADTITSGMGDYTLYLRIERLQ